MNPQTLIPIGIFVTLLSGCIEPAPPQEVSVKPTTPGQAADPSAATEVPGADAPDPLSAPRSLQVGDWWRVRVQSQYFSEDLVATLVVAEVQADHYLIGVSPVDPQEADGAFEAESDAACPYCGAPHAFDAILEIHIPPIGPIKKATLAFESHERTFEPVQFPLTPDRTWDSNWWGTPTKLKVTNIEGPRATIQVSNDWTKEYATIVYDDEIGFLRSFNIPGYASFEVLEHGSGHQGDVWVPTDYEVLFDDGRWRAVLWGPSPKAPLLSVQVPLQFTRLTVGVILDPDAPGFYEVRLTPPRGDERAFQLLPSDGVVRKVHFAGVDSPGGAWQIRFTAGGDGYVTAEGIASQVKIVTL